MNLPAQHPSRFVALSILVTLVLFAALQASALWHTGGVFEYPLDDVYIHLAVAENIGAGGYGVNAGEFTSAASSPLYPLLLLPVVPPEIQRFLPLFWNIVGLIALAWLWALILIEAGYEQPRFRSVGYLLAMAGPAVVLGVTTAYVGMEHVLHGAASLAIVLGLFKLLHGKSGTSLLLIGAFFAPALRLEGLALALLASGTLVVVGQWRLGLLVGVLAILPVAGFSGFLVSLGLEPLPGSVLAKLKLSGQLELNFTEQIIRKFRFNLTRPGGWLLAILTLSIWGMLLFSERMKSGPTRIFSIAVFLAGLAHLLFGQLGWLNRYEHYAFAMVYAAYLLLLPIATGAWPRMASHVLAVLPSIALIAVYLPDAIGLFPVSSRAIYTQQTQMARFAQVHMKTDVAVNDLGRVAWGNSNYVLDLEGLGSPEARQLRLNNPQPGWAGPLVAKHQIPVAMIFDERLGDAVGPNWVPVGALVLKNRQGFLGSHRVAFYATSPEHVAQVRAALDTWVPTLHPLTYFEYAEGME